MCSRNYTFRANVLDAVSIQSSSIDSANILSSLVAVCPAGNGSLAQQLRFTFGFKIDGVQQALVLASFFRINKFFVFFSSVVNHDDLGFGISDAFEADLLC